LNNTQPQEEESREPKLSLVIANPLFPEPVRDTAGNVVKDVYKTPVEPVVWGVERAHPFVPGMKIEAMFVDGDLIEVYSTDGKIGMRDLIPMNTIRLAEEGMPLDVYEEEMAKSAGEELVDGDPEPGTDTEDDPPRPQANESAPS